MFPHHTHPIVPSLQSHAYNTTFSTNAFGTSPVGAQLHQADFSPALPLQDFAAAGHAWTQELCQADSDGDGYSNGQELGDPGCTVRRPSLRQLPPVLLLCRPATVRVH